MNIAVIGSGSWGLALSNHLTDLKHNVNVWSFSEEEKNLINKEHKCMFLPDLLKSDRYLQVRDGQRASRDVCR